MAEINKVLYNEDQSLSTTAEQKAIARKNIGLDNVSNKEFLVDSSEGVKNVTDDVEYKVDIEADSVESFSDSDVVVVGFQSPKMKTKPVTALFAWIKLKLGIKSSEYDESKFLNEKGEFVKVVGGGAKRRNDAELYLYHTGDYGDLDYHVRNIKNYCINHVAVANHSSDMCSVVIEAPTLATGEEYDYVVVFDCVNSSGSCNVSVENCDPEIEIKWEVDTTAVPMKTFAIDVSYTEVSWTGSPQYQIEVIGGRWQRHRF